MIFKNGVWLQSVALVSLCLMPTIARAQQNDVAQTSDKVQREADRADAGIAERTNVPRLNTEASPSAIPTRVAPPLAATFAGDVAVGAIRVDGATTFRAAQFAPLFEAYIGRRLGPADLKAIAQGVAEMARARGYVFATAWIPAQSVTNGVLRVRLDEGRIDEVRVNGLVDPAISRRLGVLADGRPVTRAELERALLLAGDLPGVAIGQTRYLRERTRGVLVVDTSAKRIEGNVQIDNWGSGAVGPVRVRVRTDLNGALFAGDQLSLRGTVTPFDPSELATVGFDYAADTGADGLLAGFGASYTHVRPGDRAPDDRIDGRSTSVNANLSYPLLRTPDANIWTTIDFTVRDVEQDRSGALFRNDRLSTVTVGVSGYRGWLGGWLYARLNARQGVDLFDATRRGDPLASRRGGSAIFSKLDIYADWTGPIAGALSLKVAGEGQVASRALLSSEEMGIGGPRFGRAYDYSERSGDHGITGLAELRYDIKDAPFKGRPTRIYAFADAGTVGNFGTGGRGGSLYSAGAGVRFDISKVFDAGAEIGFPIGHDRYETGNRNPRLSFSLSARF